LDWNTSARKTIRETTTRRRRARDQEIRAALDQHWAASDANDFETEHRIYHEDAVLDYPQSGERTRGRRNIQNQRASQPSNKRFTVRRIIGGGDLWVTELVITYDAKPSYTVSIMEFRTTRLRAKHSTSRIHSRPPHFALNGSNAWTHNLEAREFALTSEGVPMDGTNGLKETTRVTAPVASNTPESNPLSERFYRPGKADGRRAAKALRRSVRL
jgi:hypothetical protein